MAEYIYNICILYNGTAEYVYKGNTPSDNPNSNGREEDVNGHNIAIKTTPNIGPNGPTNQS